MVISCTTSTVVDKINYSYVDLGLPSKTQWCTQNVGSMFPSDIGDYFAWGEIFAKDYYSWEEYKFYEYNPSCKWNVDDIVLMTKYNTNGYPKALKVPFSDGKSVLEKSDDVANVKSKGLSRVPSKKQWEELFKECKRTDEVLNGMAGARFEGHNGNSIFIPYGGHRELDKPASNTYGQYWTSDLFTDTIYRSCKSHNAIVGKITKVGAEFRFYGLPIRPVRCKGTYPSCKSK